MTETEAREKWCPHVRIARREEIEVKLGGGEIVVVAGCNSDALGRTRVPGSCTCIGSRCMMWLWFDDDHGSCGLSRG